MPDESGIAEWKQFEIAVADFLRAVDPHAKVTHDQKIPDEHTGELRQRDVWIEGTLCQLFRIKILVSCKFLKRRLNEQDIDAFNGEFISSGAHKGVIYAKEGFTDAAIQKATKLDFACCRLYENQPPDIPAALFLTAYCLRNQFSLLLTEKPDPAWQLATWGELFATEIVHQDKRTPAIDTLCEIHDQVSSTHCQ